MNIERFTTGRDLSAALASRVLEIIADRPRTVLGLPTGRTPLGFYRELRERGRAARTVDWSLVRTFNLDEFVGLASSHPASYRAFMQAELFDHVSLRSDHIGFLDGAAGDLVAECRRYDEAIAGTGGIDLQILGIGANGHIGFNEPADGLSAETHVATLTRATREASAQRFGQDWTQVPEHALSMGMATILGARDIILIATGPGKADAVKGMVDGPITTRLPASLLQVHTSVTVMVDREAWPR